MFKPRLTTVFASRWKALWWCTCILATAYCAVPKADNGNGGQMSAEAQAQAEQAMMALEAMGSEKPHSGGQDSGGNPWAIKGK